MLDCCENEGFTSDYINWKDSDEDSRMQQGRRIEKRRAQIQGIMGYSNSGHRCCIPQHPRPFPHTSHHDVSDRLGRQWFDVLSARALPALNSTRLHPRHSGQGW